MDNRSKRKHNKDKDRESRAQQPPGTYVMLRYLLALIGSTMTHWPLRKNTMTHQLLSLLLSSHIKRVRYGIIGFA